MRSWIVLLFCLTVPAAVATYDTNYAVSFLFSFLISFILFGINNLG